jgi:hypothetical protein
MIESDRKEREKVYGKRKNDKRKMNVKNSHDFMECDYRRGLDW